MEKKIKLSLENEDYVDYQDFNPIHQQVTKQDKFCWGCENTLYPHNKNEEIQQMFTAYKNKKGHMTDYKIAEHLVEMKKKMFPEDEEEFSVEDMLHHLNNHMFDLFTELHNQIEKCNTLETVLNDCMIAKNKEGQRIVDHDTLKSREMILNKKIMCLKELNKLNSNTVVL